MHHQQGHKPRHEQQRADVAKRNLQARQSSNGILWNDLSVQSAPLTQCENVTLAWNGGNPPYTLVGTWWETSMAYSDAAARQWIIAQGIPDTSYIFNGMSCSNPPCMQINDA